MVTRACFLMASLARIHARAEWIARSGPHLSGLFTRIASQNPAISYRVADGRLPGCADVLVCVDGAFAGYYSSIQPIIKP